MLQSAAALACALSDLAGVWLLNAQGRLGSIFVDPSGLAVRGLPVGSDKSYGKLNVSLAHDLIAELGECWYELSGIHGKSEIVFLQRTDNMLNLMRANFRIRIGFRAMPWSRVEAASPRHPVVCQEESLPVACAKLPDAVELLKSSCLTCWQSSCSRRHSLYFAAASVWIAADSGNYPCLQAAVAAGIVFYSNFGLDPAQPDIDAAVASPHFEAKFDYYYQKLVSSATQGLLPGVPLLAPYPFEDWIFPFVSKLWLVLEDPPCFGFAGGNGASFGKRRGETWGPAWLAMPSDMNAWTPAGNAILLPRTRSLKTGPPCAVAISDRKLALRCLDRFVGPVELGPFGLGGNKDPRANGQEVAWECPSVFEGEKNQRLQKYALDSRSCVEHSSWGRPLHTELKCVAVTIAERLLMMPGDLVLDYGSGCGFMLSWLHTFYGIEGFGIDATNQLVAWAANYSHGRYCEYGGMDLSWVPDGQFHHIISYWVFYHLPTVEAQCHVAQQLIAKLRPGGTMWIGGNVPVAMLKLLSSNMYQEDWLQCFANGQTRVWLEFIGDHNLFRGTSTDPLDQDIYLFHPGTYSVFITRQSH